MSRENSSKRKLGIIILMSMLLASLGTIGGSSNTSEHNVANDSTIRFIDADFVLHHPIIITHDDNFTQMGFTGSGTEGDPYLIEDLDIFQDFEDENCIEINNTRAFFTIDGCLLNGTGPWASIYMFNVTNGNIINNQCEGALISIYALEVSDTTIEGNTCVNTEIAIRLEDADTNVVQGNTCNTNCDGIWLEKAVNNTIVDNTCSDYWQGGIMLGGGTSTRNNTIKNNTLYGGQRGIWLGGVNNTIVGNRMYSCGLAMQNSMEQKLVENNTVNGRPSIFHQFEDGISIPSNAGEVILLGCNNVIIQGLNINGTTRGIALYDSSNVTIGNNTITNTRFDAIDLGDCLALNITNNYLSGGFMGISCGGFFGGSPSDRGVIRNNYADGFHTPIALWEAGFEVCWNTLHGFHDDAFDDKAGSTFHHNFYSEYSGVDENDDGIGDTPFTVEGDAESVDSYPLMYENNPPIWAVEETITSEFGEALEIPLGIESSSPIIGHSFKGAGFSFDGEVLRNNTYLQIGEYQVHITIENLYELVLDEWLTIIIEDTTPPDMIESRTIHHEYGSYIVMDLEINDLSGIRSIKLHHPTSGILFEVNESGYLLSKHRNDPYYGEYTLGITVTDNCGLSTSIEILFIVADTTPPTFIRFWGNTTLEVGETGNLTFQVFDCSYLDGWYNVSVNGHHRGGGVWWGENITIDVGSNTPGEYTYIITVYDRVRNFESYAVIVRVVDPTQELILQVVFAGAILAIPTIVILIVVIKRMSAQ